MAFLEVHTVYVKEILRRWQAVESKMAIARASGVSARTAGRHIEAAASLGLKRDGEPAGEEVLAQLLRRNHPGPLQPGRLRRPPAWRKKRADCEVAPMSTTPTQLLETGITLAIENPASHGISFFGKKYGKRVALMCCLYTILH